MPPRLVERQSILKRKDFDDDEEPGIMAMTTREDNLSGQETEPDESMEHEEDGNSNETQPAGRRLTAASRFTNQV